MGDLLLHRFPDGESYVRVLTPVTGKRVIVVCTLDRPDSRIMPLYFLCRTLKDQGAESVTLVAPYLGYMRMDKQFNPGEAVSSVYFASLLSGVVDRLVTVDPHLHRHPEMSAIYSVPCQVIQSASAISSWIRLNVQKPVIIGPDSESAQWVSEVAGRGEFPFLVMEKIRKGDKNVSISLRDTNGFADHTPVLVDDIISTAQTMIETVTRLLQAGRMSPVCIGVHGIFAGNAFQELKAAGVARIVTTNTIQHETNDIDVSELIIAAISQQ